MAPGFALVIMLGLAVIFYKAADLEDLPHPLLWAGTSIFVFVGAVHGLHWGLCGALFLQLLLFVGMGAWLAATTPRGRFSIRDLLAQWRLSRGRWSIQDWRAQRRLNRGLCPQCAYDLQGTRRPGECPECGARIPEASP